MSGIHKAGMILQSYGSSYGSCGCAFTETECAECERKYVLVPPDVLDGLLRIEKVYKDLDKKEALHGKES